MCVCGFARTRRNGEFFRVSDKRKALHSPRSDASDLGKVRLVVDALQVVHRLGGVWGDELAAIPKRIRLCGSPVRGGGHSAAAALHHREAQSGTEYMRFGNSESLCDKQLHAGEK